jgi:murein DD-endopeptidase MepM/ murein hydrolase activator NlpD
MKITSIILLSFVLFSFGFAQEGFICPVKNYETVSKQFGKVAHPVSNAQMRHEGIDFDVPVGTPVLAASAGKVIQAGTIAGYGTVVKIQHAHRTQTFYAHLSKLAVKKGETVQRGEVIAYSGGSGLSSAPHLHYEVIVKDQPVDPSSYVH